MRVEMGETLWRHVRRIHDESQIHSMTDGELVACFAESGDRDAFEELFRRCAPLVWGVCVRTLGATPEAEDAFQAVFLLLVQNVRKIRDRSRVSSWLYGATRKVAGRAARRRTRRDRRERSDHPDREPMCEDAAPRDWEPLLEAALGRMPAKYRDVLVLCELQEKSRAEAAKILNLSENSLSSRLARAKEMLRARLARTGVALPAGLAPLAIVPTALQSASLQLALRLADHAGPPAQVIPSILVPLIHGGSKLMFATKSFACLALGVLVTLGLSSPEAVPQGKAENPPVAKPAQGPVVEKVEPLVTRDNLPEGAIARIGSPRLRHAGEIVSMAFSHDGRWLATASPATHDKSVRVWDLADGKEKHRIAIAANPNESTAWFRPVAIEFSGDDKRLLLLDGESFRAIDLSTGKPAISKTLFTAKDKNQFFEPQGIIGTRFSPDGKTYAAVRQDGELLLGETATGEVKTAIAKSMNLPENSRYSHVKILFTPDGSEVCVPIEAESIPIFETATGKSSRSWAKKLLPRGVSTVTPSFVGDGTKFLSAGTTQEDGEKFVSSVSIGDVATGKSLRTIPIPVPPRALALSPNGKLLAVAGDSMASSEVRVLDLESGKELQTVPLVLSPSLVVFSPDSKLLAATCHYGGRATVWDIEKNAPHPQSADGNSIQAHFDRRGNLELNRFTRVVTVDWRTGKILEEKKRERDWARFWSGDGKRVAEIHSSKEKPTEGRIIQVKETATDRTISRLEGVTDHPWRMIFADQNRLLVTVTQDSVLSVWDIAEQKLIWSENYGGRSFGYSGMGEPHFDSANRRLAICSMVENATVIDVWELRRLTKLARIEVPSTLLTNGIAFSPDGESIAGGQDEVTCWRVSDGKAVHKLLGQAKSELPYFRSSVRCKFSEDGRKLLTVDESGTIRVWEFATGQVIRTFSGHHGKTLAAFSPDGRTIVGASSEAPILIWDVYGQAAKPPFDADRIWNDLAYSDSAATAFDAVRQLCGSPKEAIALLKEKLKPASIDQKVIDGWIKDLSTERFAVREKAAAELEKEAESIAPLLRKALDASTDEEARQRISTILGKLETTTPARLRQQRAMDALEHLGTSEAKEHLESLGRGSPGHWRTVQAKEALSRLSER